MKQHWNKFWCSFILGILFFIFVTIYLSESRANRTVEKYVLQTISTNLQTISTTFQIISTNFQTISTNQLISRSGFSAKNPHLISVFVGTTPTIQIRVDNFSFKDGVLFCQVLNRDFYIIGSMHSILIEEIKTGINPIINILRVPAQQKEQNQYEKPSVIN